VLHAIAAGEHAQEAVEAPQERDPNLDIFVDRVAEATGEELVEEAPETNGDFVQSMREGE
jgi:hypothetical protein